MNRKRVTFNDKVEIFGNGFRSVGYLKSKEDQRSIYQKRVDKDRFKRNVAQNYEKILSELLIHKLSIINGKENHL